VGSSMRRGVIGVVVAVVLAGCSAPATSTDDADLPSALATPVDDENGRVEDAPKLSGEPGKWELTGASPDGSLLTLATSVGGCGSFEGWTSEETAEKVHVEAWWEHSGDDACRAILHVAQVTLRLERPLGDRQLTGCARADCLALPDDRDGGSFGPSNQVSAANDALVVTGFDTAWSVDPSDGTVRWERARDGYWSRAVDGMVLRFDHIDHIEMLDAVTGETRWDADDVTLADIAGDEVVVCPREQALDDGPRVSFRGALSVEEGSWLWREEGASCTTGAADRDNAEVPDVDLVPEQIGRSAAVDLATHDGIVYVATSTAIIALDPSTGERLWWTLLVPSTAVDVGGIHAPAGRP
jgi:outer membrane protein assembly factor BamB